jgi:two-component system, cell cycle response regulator DivK
MSHHVLVVEDNPANCELLNDWLESEGFEVASAVNLDQAFAALKRKRPDVVLLDVQLGAEDGLAVAVWLRNEPALSAIPIIAVTAHAMIADQERMLQAGCSACISKPVDFSRLKRQLDHWLRVMTKSRPHP